MNDIEKKIQVTSEKIESLKATIKTLKEKENSLIEQIKQATVSGQTPDEIQKLFEEKSKIAHEIEIAELSIDAQRDSLNEPERQAKANKILEIEKDASKAQIETENLRKQIEEQKLKLDALQKKHNEAFARWNRLSMIVAEMK